MTTRLCIFATHPVQYHVPLWRELSATPGLDVKILYLSDQGTGQKLDRDFGISIAWDVDLESGYDFEYLSRDGRLDEPTSMVINDLEDILRRERPDWVMISGHHCGFQRQLLRGAHRSGAQLLMRGEFSDTHLHERPFIERLLRRAYLRMQYRSVDRFCYPGETARKHLANHGVRPEQMFFSPYSVNNKLFLAQAADIDREQVRRELGISPDCFVFLISGKLIDRKDPLAVVDALERIVGPNRVGLLVLGDGELRDESIRRGRAVLRDDFFFRGFVNQSELSRYFIAADAFVLPSKHETWGLVVNEAMLHGLPVVASNRVGCVPDLVVPGATGHTYVQGNTKELSERLEKLVTNQTVSSAMGKAAKARIAHYSVRESARGVAEALGVKFPQDGEEHHRGPGRVSANHL